MEDKFILEFVGQDDFSQPVFKVKGKKYFVGSTSILIPDSKLGLVDEKSICKYFSENMNMLEYFGNHFGCEPMGTRLKIEKFVIKGFENE